MQKPHPPIHFGGESDAALERTAALGQGWFGYGLTPEKSAESGSGRELPYDGFAEVWLESEEAMRLSGRSPEARLTLDDEKNLFDLSIRFSVIVQEHVMIGE